MSIIEVAETRLAIPMGEIKRNTMDEQGYEYRDRIQRIMPDLSIESIRLNQEGLANAIVVVNESLVFRFARSERSQEVMAAEARILEHIRPHISLPIPDLLHHGEDVMVYPLLVGASLTRDRFRALSPAGQATVIAQVAEFLKELHGCPVLPGLPETAAPVHYATWLEIRQRVEEKVFPLLMAHQREWATALYDRALSNPANFDYTQALIHGDLGCYHLLLDPERERLSGVIDFGVAGVGDPANDIACLLQYYGEGWVKRLREGYPEMDGLMERARFYAQAIELEWALAGITRGQEFWFLAHLGARREVDEG